LIFTSVDEFKFQAHHLFSYIDALGYTQYASFNECNTVPQENRTENIDGVPSGLVLRTTKVVGNATHFTHDKEGKTDLRIL